MNTAWRHAIRVGLALLLLAAPACAQRGDDHLPPVAPVHGPLRLSVAYPSPGTAIDAGDSTFLFGTAGDGDATVSVNGAAAHVAANGAWIAWIALPHDSAFTVSIVARKGRDSTALRLPLTRARWVRTEGPWADRSSMYPTGDVALPAGESLPLTVRASPGSSVRLLLAGGRSISLAADSLPDPVPESVRAFDRDERNLRTQVTGDRYVGTWPPETAPAEPWDSRGQGAIVPLTLEITRGGAVTRVPWPLRVRRVLSASVVLDDDPGHRGGTDRMTVGRATPNGTYTWFFPEGTRTRADMRIGDDVRLRLDDNAVAWVPASDVHVAAATDDPRRAIAGPLTFTAESGYTRLRIPLNRPVPLSVEETGPNTASVTLYGTVSNVNWTRYGANQRFVRVAEWRQENGDRLRLDLTFSTAPWGWRSRVDGTDLVLDFRAPPAIDASRPLAGRRIVIDPGHPPQGACGPTVLCEAVVNLQIAQLVQRLLTEAGANVIMTRTSVVDVGLWPRVALADSVDAELLVSIHNNAFPDGINPFTNSGTTTFFNHPHSIELARAVQNRLVEHLGLRDLGVVRGDYALVRPTWYPAILTEGLYLMIPEQEAALRTESGRSRYAAGVVDGIVDFLKDLGRISPR